MEYFHLLGLVETGSNSKRLKKKDESHSLEKPSTRSKLVDQLIVLHNTYCVSN